MRDRLDCSTINVADGGLFGCDGAGRASVHSKGADDGKAIVLF